MDYPKEIDMGMFLKKRDNIDDQESRYYLFGLTEHEGSTDGQGHYTAHTLREGSWYKFDDEFFCKVTQRDVYARQAYLLFYKRY